VLKFVTQFQYNESDKKMGLDDKIRFIEACIKANQSLDITYLKANNDKSKRMVTPTFVGEMVYQNKSYLGMKGFCHKAQEERAFRVDRILEIREGLKAVKKAVVG